MEKYITNSPGQTKELGEILAKEARTGVIICLQGDLGSGKTTFAQGFLSGLKVSGPHTSPTFVIMKKYQMPHGRQDVYHVDAYRTKGKDILDLGWKEIISNKKNIVIIEWAERIKKIIPLHSLWIKFKLIDKNKRELTIAKN